MDVVHSIRHLATMAGSDTTDVEAIYLRDLLVERNLLTWQGDRGFLTATDPEWDAAVTGMCEWAVAQGIA